MFRRRKSAPPTAPPSDASPPITPATLEAVRDGTATDEELLHVAASGGAPLDVLAAIWERYETGGDNTAAQTALCDTRVNTRTRGRLLRGAFADASDMWAATLAADLLPRRMIRAAVKHDSEDFLAAVVSSPHPSHHPSDETLIGIIASAAPDPKREVAARELVFVRQECAAPWQTGDPLIRDIVVEWANELSFPTAPTQPASCSAPGPAGMLLWKMTADGREPQIKQVFAEAPIGDGDGMLRPSVVLAAALGSYQLRDLAVNRLVSLGGHHLDRLLDAADTAPGDIEATSAAHRAAAANLEALRSSIEASLCRRAEASAAESLENSTEPANTPAGDRTAPPDTEPANVQAGVIRRIDPGTGTVGSKTAARRSAPHDHATPTEVAASAAEGSALTSPPPRPGSLNPPPPAPPMRPKGTTSDTGGSHADRSVPAGPQLM